MKWHPERIRNFCIIAHIDHGKSTLADRMLEITDTITERERRDQLLDDMELERERGITIKSHPVNMAFRAADGHVYQLNLMDTPGHVDFSYEVARSLQACEGALLVVDAAQGVEAQTVANTYLAVDLGLTIVPVLNKIDLPAANPLEVRQQIEDILAMPADDCFEVSAKTGAGVAEVLQAVVDRIPPPKARIEQTRALVFDSRYDAYRGVISYVRVFDGAIRAGDSVMLMSSGLRADVKEVGHFKPHPVKCAELRAGDVGYLVPNIRDVAEVRIGDTITQSRDRALEPLPGFREVHPMVFTGLYPIDTADYEKMKASIEKLSINDRSFEFQPETSVALGFGFRCGFLGLLHMEIIQERLRREYDLDLISTYPSVVHRVHMRDGTMIEVDNPVHMPDPTCIASIEEPIINATIICRNENIGDMLQLVMERRGSVQKTESIDTRRVMLTCRLPLTEILVDFHDRLKSVSRGYASFDYEMAGYEASDLVRLDILVHGESVDAFSCIVHRARADARGRGICKALKDVIPPQQFAVPLQASVQRKIIARETIRALRKDVTAKCYGGDITRKRKLLERQKEGKKRMKQVGSVNIPQEAFISVLKTD